MVITVRSQVLKNLFIAVAIATLLISCSAGDDSEDGGQTPDIGPLYPEILQPSDPGVGSDLPFSDGPCKGLAEGEPCDESLRLG